MSEAAGYRYPFSPYPSGWYQVGWSDELPVGSVQPLQVFGRDLVLFRTESGAATVLDAHCPHLGAHVGEGGTVVGETIRCPFHHWRFASTGECVEAPYESKGRVPKASLGCWRVHEVSGLVLVHTPLSAGQEPTWHMPEMAEFNDPEWRGYEKRTYRVRMHVQELAENVPDRAHFLYVHGTGVIPDIEYATEGHVYRQSTKLNLGDGMSMTFRQTILGLGLIWLRNEDMEPANVFLSAPTPVDQERVDIRVSYLFHESRTPSDAARGFLEMMDGQFEQDTRIWEHKVYRERPRLIEGDGPLPDLRRWARQFYEPRAIHSRNA